MKSAYLFRPLSFVSALAIPVAGASAQFIPIDNFDDGDDKGWLRFHSNDDFPGVFDASSGCYHMSTAIEVPENVFTTVSAQWAASDQPAFSNGRFRALVRANTPSTNPGMTLRWDLEAAQGFVFVADSDTGILYILRVAGFTQEPIGAMVETDFRINQNWIFEAGAIGDELSFKIWPVGAPVPAEPQLVAHDSAYPQGVFALAAAHPIPSVRSQLSVCFDDVVFFPACPADFNLDGVPNSQDFFDFVAAFLSLEPRADFNNDAAVNSQDFFDFLTAFFAGC